MKKTSLIFALVAAFSFVSPSIAADKNPATEEKKEKKELPPEIKAQMDAIKAKVKAGEMTKEEGKEAMKKVIADSKKKAPEKAE
jgi:hypothetical protein